MRRQFFALAIALFSLALPTRSHGQSVVLSHIHNDKPTALTFKVLQEAYRRLGIEAKEEFLPHERSLRASDAGEVDGEVMRIAGLEKEYPNLLRVPEPIYEFDTIAFTTGLVFKVEGWESLRPYQLCVLRGLKLSEQGTEGMNRMIGNSVDHLIEMLRRDRCQVAILGRASWLEIDRLKAGPLRELQPPIATLQLFHYVNKRHAALVPKLAETLRQMRVEGVISAITASEDQAIAEAKRRNSFPE
jgi:polar amino acid transport system substrate-binding protein